MLPALPYQTYHLVSSQAGPPALGIPLKYAPINRLNLPGHRDEAVKEYCTWQKMQFKGLELKEHCQKACIAIMANHMTLELIRQDPDPGVLIKSSVKRGIAQRVVDYWVENVKRVRTEEQQE